MSLQDIAPILIGVIAAIASVLSASIPYYFTKKGERDANARQIKENMRQKKLDRYDDLLDKLTNFVARPSDQNIIQEFIVAYYRASAYAHHDVLKACYKILSSATETTRLGKPYNITEDMINEVYNAISRDVLPTASNFYFGAFHVARKA